MAEFVQACEDVRSLMGERPPDWGTLPWAVDRLLDCLGGGFGLDATDALDMTRDEVVALGQLLVHLSTPELVTQAEELLYQ